MFEFNLPDLGEGVAEGEVLTWHVSPGDAVTEDQVLAEVETDKAAVDVPSPVDGVVQELHAEVGEMVQTGEVLITIDEAGDAEADDAAAGSAADAESAEATTEAVADDTASEATAPMRRTSRTQARPTAACSPRRAFADSPVRRGSTSRPSTGAGRAVASPRGTSRRPQHRPPRRPTATTAPRRSFRRRPTTETVRPQQFRRSTMRTQTTGMLSSQPSEVSPVTDRRPPIATRRWRRRQPERPPANST